LSEDLRAACVQHQLLGEDKVTGRQLKPVVERGRELKGPVGFKTVAATW
jgi:hypothetical protein